MSLFHLSLVLFLIMDPVGSLSTYLSLIKDFPRSRQLIILLREMGIALGIMIAFNYLGEYIFDFLELSEVTVRLASGVILFLIAVKILFTAKDNPRANLPAGEPFIFPLAVPLIAGPALLATIMLYARLEPLQSMMIFAILIAWAITGIIFFFAAPIKKILGTNGLAACERLIGMVLVLIAVQRFLEGILLFIHEH